MNEPPPFLPELPPQPEAFIRPTLPPPRPSVNCPPKPLGANPEEQAPIIGLVSAMEALLRQPRRVMFQLRQPGAGGLILNMIGIGLVCCLVYGFVAGTFSGGPQLWAAPVKIAGGLLFAGLICLPSLYIFTCLGGAQARLAEVTGLVAGLVALLSVLLVGFAPVALVFSQSTESLSAMGALHILFGLVAAGFGLRFLSAGFAHFGSRGRSGLSFWSLMFLLVSLQMTTALRPIIGRSKTFFPTEKTFFLSHWGQCLMAPEKVAQPKPAF